MRQDFLFKTL